MSVIRQGSTEKVRVFAYAQLSSYLHRHLNTGSIKSLSQMSGVPYGTLLGIKNMKLKHVSLPRLIDVMVKVGMTYSITMVNQASGELVVMEIDHTKYDPKVERVLKRDSFDMMVKQYSHRLN